MRYTTVQSPVVHDLTVVPTFGSAFMLRCLAFQDLSCLKLNTTTAPSFELLRKANLSFGSATSNAMSFRKLSEETTDGGNSWTLKIN